MKFVILAWVWFLLYGSCLGRFVVEKNSLKVTSPDSLKDVYECAIGNFGVPDYGGTMVGSVFYPKLNQQACKNFEDVDVSLKKKPGGIPMFLLADRGGKVSRFLRTSIFVNLLWFAQRMCFG